jgi:hypothetical protein
MRIIALSAWKAALIETFGTDAVFCLEQLSQEEIDARLASAATPTGNEEQDKKNKAKAAVWVMDPSGEVVVPARKSDFSFYAVVVENIGYEAPILVEEPDPEDPRRTKRDTVGDVAALIAVGPDGRVYVKTAMVKRKAATGGDDPILEIDRSSTSKGEKLSGRPVGSGGYTNSARIRGLTRDLVAEAASAAVDTEPGWMPVAQFALTSPDRIGKAAVLTALAELGHIR